MNNTEPFIIIKGQPKSQEIDRIILERSGAYSVKYKSSFKSYFYKKNDVIFIPKSVWHDPLRCKLFLDGQEVKNVSEIRSFLYENNQYWRIKFNNGFIRECLPDTVRLVESCLAEQKSKDVFEYLKSISQTNELGKDATHSGILFSLYEKLEFIDKTLSVAPYLNPKKYHVKSYSKPNLIFPFGCNASQLKAVIAAFENQISVIQGPPGTGKTQTILNIMANVIMQGKTVLVVSNNNSATANISEKLKKYELDFIVAALGKRDNKEEFIAHQPHIPEHISSQAIVGEEVNELEKRVSETLLELDDIFVLQEKLASAKQELQAVELEWTHFKQECTREEYPSLKLDGIKSTAILNLWLRCQNYVERKIIPIPNWRGKVMAFFQRMMLNLSCKFLMKRWLPSDIQDITDVVTELQALYYQSKIKELNSTIKECEVGLRAKSASKVSERLTDSSMKLFKHSLYKKYERGGDIQLSSAAEIQRNGKKVLERYPVILSTTFSARTSISEDIVYDYLIMDEASQVSIETGALALTCAKNAVVVGDTLQLPNVVTEEDKLKLNSVFNRFEIAPGYNSAEYSFLQSVCTIIPHVKQTLLREHYRCHPKIINFCNQRFYGGNLLIMTEDDGAENVMLAIKTTPGLHCHNFYNQREIDVVKEEILPRFRNGEDVGIVTPYNAQVEKFNQQIPTIETATIHKYQGREKDTIVMSVVDDQITKFSDDANLLNVAVSRAKKKFCIVLTGNEQNLKGNINELVQYIQYNNFEVAKSKVNSIFDFLFSQYTDLRMAKLAHVKRVSEYDSENLTYQLLTDILRDYPEFNHLGVHCHVPLHSVIRDTNLLDKEQCQYATHPNTHLDFLIVNHVTKKPVLAIETDGYSFHHIKTVQHQRDILKDRILELYGLPLLRLNTNGSGEKERVLEMLRNALL